MSHGGFEHPGWIGHQATLPLWPGVVWRLGIGFVIWRVGVGSKLGEHGLYSVFRGYGLGPLALKGSCIAPSG